MAPACFAEFADRVHVSLDRCGRVPSPSIPLCVGRPGRGLRARCELRLNFAPKGFGGIGGLERLPELRCERVEDLAERLFRAVLLLGPLRRRQCNLFGILPRRVFEHLDDIRTLRVGVVGTGDPLRRRCAGFQGSVFNFSRGRLRHCLLQKPGETLLLEREGDIALPVIEVVPADKEDGLGRLGRHLKE